ncbi:MAG TPA: hypothetical protein VHP38_09115, partial [Ruminiclostridium sp.]|nr:hypothetical protein [Ruminiclostridium sp.]
ILFTRTGSTKLEDYLGENKPQQKAHMISVWCNRIKSSLIKNIIRFLKNHEYYLIQKGGQS